MKNRTEIEEVKEFFGEPRRTIVIKTTPVITCYLVMTGIMVMGVIFLAIIKTLFN